MRNYKQISSKNREEIMAYLAKGDNQEIIAKKTGLSQSAISREPKKGKDRGVDNPFLAQRKTGSYTKSKSRAL